MPAEPPHCVDSGVATVTIRWPPRDGAPATECERRFYLHWKLRSVIEFVASDPMCPLKWALARGDRAPPQQFKTEHAQMTLKQLGFPERGLVLIVGTPKPKPGPS